MMAIGYFYNVTFIQLGLKDLGERRLALPATAVAGQMALLALVTCLTALAFGWQMARRGWSARLLVKLQLATGVIIVQTILTAVAPHVSSQAGFLIWIIFCSLALGVGVPATFSLTTDLIPVRDRGYAAAAIMAVAYFAAALFPGDWQIEPFSRAMLLIMLPGAAVLGLIVALATAGRSFVAVWVAELADNHRQARRFGDGRFSRCNRGALDRQHNGYVYSGAHPRDWADEGGGGDQPGCFDRLSGGIGRDWFSRRLGGRAAWLGAGAGGKCVCAGLPGRAGGGNGRPAADSGGGHAALAAHFRPDIRHDCRAAFRPLSRLERGDAVAD